MKKRVLITGGAGFIGSNLVRYHLEKGNDVWAIDDLSTGDIRNLQGQRVRFSKGKVQELAELREAVRWADQIYHMAATVGEKKVIGEPIETLSNNIASAEALLKLLTPEKKAILASSASIYWDTPTNEDGSHSESAVIHFPSNEFLQVNYGLSKMAVETMALSYGYEKNLNCVLVRLFNTIGPLQKSQYGMVIPNFIEQALSGRPITVYGDGTQMRSFCHIKDSMRAMDLLMETPSSRNQIVNVGHDEEKSIFEVAQLIKQKADSPSEIIFVPYREAYGMDFKDLKRRKPDLKKLIGLTAFSPEYNLDRTLTDIVDRAK